MIFQFLEGFFVWAVFSPIAAATVTTALASASGSASFSPSLLHEVVGKADDSTTRMRRQAMAASLAASTAGEAPMIGHSQARHLQTLLHNADEARAHAARVLDANGTPGARAGRAGSPPLVPAATRAPNAKRPPPRLHTRKGNAVASASELRPAPGLGCLGGHPGFIMPPRVRPPPTRTLLGSSASTPQLVPKPHSSRPAAKLIDILTEDHDAASAASAAGLYKTGQHLSSAAASWARHRRAGHRTMARGRSREKTPPPLGPWAASRFGMSTAWQEERGLSSLAAGVAANMVQATVHQIGA